MPRISRNRRHSDSDTIETQSITTTSTSISEESGASEFANNLYELISYLEVNDPQEMDIEMFDVVLDTLKECYARLYDEEYEAVDDDSEDDASG
jgi:hypothetical protein